MNKLTLGLIVNPVAGIGGAVGLKGSDGEAVQALAQARGAIPRANQRVGLFLQALGAEVDAIHWLVWNQSMGAAVLQQHGCGFAIIGAENHSQQTAAADTIAAAKAMQDAGVDLILFAGGDGTARDLVQAIGNDFPALGIPAGVKIHSGVYAVHAQAAAEIVKRMMAGKLVRLQEGEVRDIDEELLRQGQVNARYYGDLLVPAADSFVQQVKCGREIPESLQLDEIGEYIAEQMEPDTLYILGAGTTTRAVAQALNLPFTLLGVDLIKNRESLQLDVSDGQILEALNDQPAKVIVTPIGGQGHLIGRGNHQLSPAVIHRVGKENFMVLATPEKLNQLEGRPLLTDSWDPAVNSLFTGLIPVITGYDERVLYPIGN